MADEMIMLVSKRQDLPSVLHDDQYPIPVEMWPFEEKP